MANQHFWQLVISPQVVTSAIKVSVIVGSVLAVINYGDRILAADMQSVDWLKLCLTYFVPYAVSTYSAVKAIQSK